MATTMRWAAAVGMLAAVGLLVLMLVVEVRPAEATFPGKNGRIAYSAWDVGTAEAIYTINPGGGAKSKLTSGYQPSYSPDGRRIAYTAWPGFSEDSELYTINVGGCGKTRLTNNNTDESDPSYSPDGKRIAYTSTTYFSRAWPKDEIYTVNVGGGAKFKVTNGSHPVYSPDGKRIVYYAYDKSSSNHLGDTEIYTIKVDGSGKTQLTHNNKDEFTPDYSPDGKRIVYAGLAGLERNDAESDIYTIKARGGGKTQVTNNENVDDLHPVYSPDGKKIAYTVYKGDTLNGDVYTINAGGGGKFRVTHGKADEGGPAWGSLRVSSSLGPSSWPYARTSWKENSRKFVCNIVRKRSGP